MLIRRHRDAVVNSDQLFKERNTLTLLLCINLPRIVIFENLKATVAFLENVFGFSTEDCQLALFDKITRTEFF